MLKATMASLDPLMVSCEGVSLRAVRETLAPNLSSSVRKTTLALIQPHASST